MQRTQKSIRSGHLLVFHPCRDGTFSPTLVKASLTPEEAQAEYDAAEPVDIPGTVIERIVDQVMAAHSPPTDVPG
jgi:hypothetical protein